MVKLVRARSSSGLHSLVLRMQLIGIVGERLKTVGHLAVRMVCR